MKDTQNCLSDSIFVEDGDAWTRVWFDNVLYFKAEDNCIKIHLKDGQITTPGSLDDLESFVNDRRFFRIHDSFIINIERVNAFNEQTAIIEEEELPISPSRVDALFSLFTILD